MACMLHAIRFDYATDPRGFSGRGRRYFLFITHRFVYS
jgi:hypothetical protein